MIRRTVSLLSLLAAVSFTAYADEVQKPEAPKAEAFSEGQKSQIQNIVREYLVKNPEVLIEVSNALQTKQMADMQNQAKDAVAENAQELFSSKTSPFVGNAKPEISVVEFFDYQCVHCKRMEQTIETLEKNNKNLKIIYKIFPIFGADSEFAGRAALAAQSQSKFLAFHKALLKSEGRLTNDQVLNIAKTVGLNVDKLKADMKKPEVEQEIKANMELARKMRLMGTPAFVISATPFDKSKEFFFVPGGTTLEKLQEYVNQSKAKSS